MVGGDGGGPGAGAARSLDALGDARLPHRPARLRRRDEARRQHVIFGLNGAGRGARPGRAGRRRPRSRLRRLRRRRRRARRTSATSAPRSSTRTTRRSAFSLDLAAKDLGLIPTLADAVGAPMPQAARQPATDPVPRSRSSAATATSPPSPNSSRSPSAGGGRDRADEHAAARPVRPNRTVKHAAERDRIVTDRILISGGHRPDPGRLARRAAARRRPGRGRQDRRGRAGPVGRRRAGDRRRPATSSSRASSTPIGTRGRRRSGRPPRTTRWAPISARSSTSSRPSTGPRTSTPATSGAPSSASTRASRRSSTGRTS